MPSSPNTTNIPPARVPFIDDRTGLMSREWYRFLLRLFSITGGGNNAVSLQDVQLGPLGAEGTAFQAALQAYVDVTPAAAPAVDMLGPPALLDVPGRFLLPAGVTPGASPYTYQNTSGRPGDVIVSGGAVLDIAFSRDNATFYGAGVVSGVFPLSAYDFLRVTYTVAPTMTFIPR